MKIIIAGGTGQVGTILARHFHRNGQSVVVLSRSSQKAPWRVVPWDGSTLGPWLDELNDSDVLINLAGRSVNCRYTRKNRREILDSRVLSTQTLHQAIAAIEHPPAVWPHRIWSSDGGKHIRDGSIPHKLTTHLSDEIGRPSQTGMS